jgi:hypothetical protein
MKFTDLPPEVQKLYSAFAPTISEMTDARLDSFIDMLTFGRHFAAMEVLYKDMTPEQRLAAQKAVNARLDKLNEKNALAVSAERQAVKDLLLALFRQLNPVMENK